MFANKGEKDRPPTALEVHATLTRKADAPLLECVIREVISGGPKRTLLAVGIKGGVIATDPHGTLDGLLADGKDRVWLGRMLWLGDHADDPKFEIHEAANAMPGLRRIGDWFPLAHGAEALHEWRAGLCPLCPERIRIPPRKLRMTRPLFLATLAGLFAAASLCAEPAPKDMKLFLLVGQSNMAGRGKVEAQDKVENPRIFMLTKDLQ